MVEEQENPTPLQLADKRSISAEVGDAAAHAVNATGASATRPVSVIHFRDGCG